MTNKLFNPCGSLYNPLLGSGNVIHIKTEDKS